MRIFNFCHLVAPEISFFDFIIVFRTSELVIRTILTNILSPYHWLWKRAFAPWKPYIELNKMQIMSKIRNDLVRQFSTSFWIINAILEFPMDDAATRYQRFRHRFYFNDRTLPETFVRSYIVRYLFLMVNPSESSNEWVWRRQRSRRRIPL